MEIIIEKKKRERAMARRIRKLFNVMKIEYIKEWHDMNESVV